MHEKLPALAAELARFLLAIVVTLQNTAILYWILTHQVPEMSKELTLLIVNGSGTLQGIVLTYYFGSSAGSALKDRAISQQMNGKQP